MKYVLRQINAALNVPKVFHDGKNMQYQQSEKKGK